MVKGFTLIELVMVVLLLSVLAAVAIPNFIDFRADAKNATTKAGVGAMRAAIGIARAAIALRESASTSPAYPTQDEMRFEQRFDGSHPVLNQTYILAPGQNQEDWAKEVYSGVPSNPWTIASAWDYRNAIRPNDNGETKGTVCTTWGHSGWCYSETNGQIWANSSKNGGTDSASAINSTENWY